MTKRPGTSIGVLRYPGQWGVCLLEQAESALLFHSKEFEGWLYEVVCVTSL